MSAEIRTARLLLRAATSVDALALVDFTGEPDTADERLRRVTALVENSENWYREHGYGLWVLERSSADGIIGWCGLRPRERPQEPELLYGLAPTARGQGFASEAVAAVVNWLFRRPEITGVWAVTDPTNTASAQVLERVGLVLEYRGEFDGLDSLVYRISVADWNARSGRG
jgi:RimJ/RimL family protein N-acetyltransferase